MTRLVPMTWAGCQAVSLGMRAQDWEEVRRMMWTEDRAEFARMHWSIPGVKLEMLADDGTPVSIGGFGPATPGVWTAWMVSTDQLHRAGRALSVEMRRRIAAMLKRPEVQRIEAHSWEGHTESHDWLRLLGFELEGVRRRAGKDGSDFFVFAAVKGG